MADVFVSYRRGDRERVRVLAELLKKKEFSVWFDVQLKVGDAGGFDSEIEKEVNSAAAVLVCWTSESVKSIYVRAEAKKGLERNCYVPVYLGKCTLPVPFNDAHAIDLSAWQGDESASEWLELLEAVDAHKRRFLANFADRAQAGRRVIEALETPQYPGAIEALVAKMIKIETRDEPSLYGADFLATLKWMSRVLEDDLRAISLWHDAAYKGISSAEHQWERVVEEGDFGERRRAEIIGLKDELLTIVQRLDQLQGVFRKSTVEP